MSAARRQALQARLVQDLAAAHSAALVVLGDRLGLYRALAAGRLTPAALAERTGTHERYVREWLRNQAAAGYVEHDTPSGSYGLSEEQAAVLAREDAPGFVPPAFQLAVGLAAGLDAVAEAFRSGGGVPPGRYGADVDAGIAGGSRALWTGRLVEKWLPSDVADRLRAGGAAADLGCGRGDAVRALAGAFPAARLVGIDASPPAIASAARDPGPANARFVVGSVPELEAGAYDLVTCIDALHDLPAPADAAARVRMSLADGGCALVVEPCVEWSGGPDALARLVSALSVLYCVPVGRSGGGEGRGAMEGEPSLLALLSAAGFSRVRVVERLPLHVVVEARP